MDSSAPKRRKTSPTTNVPIGGSTVPQPEEGGSIRRSTRRQIPSFASPTKASLARSNPDILERRNFSRGRPSSDAPAASEVDSLINDAHDAPPQEETDITRMEDDTEMTGREAQPPPSIIPDTALSPVRRATGAMASKPRRTPNKPSPRPLPPPSAEEEELVNPFRGRVLRRSPPPNSIPPEEPELPPTPTEKGISDPASVNTSPMGIHNTPTKRPRRSRALAERIKSSPKQPPLRPELPTKESIREESPSRTVERALRAQPQSRKRRRKSHPARNIEEPDPLAEKKAIRDSLLAQITRLNSDLELVTRENNRLHQLQQAKRDSSSSKGPEDKYGLLDLLRRHALPPEKEAPPTPTQNWLEVALNPISFLPFSKNTTALPSFFAPPPEKSQKDEDENPPISHHPVPMTAEEELPYLQVFTPLTFTSTVSIIPRDDVVNAGPLLQKHSISASSTPPGLFAAKIEMTVNTKSLSVAALKVPRLEPSAVSELGPFIEKVIQGNGTSSLTRNISVVTWAMSEWLRVATRRARFWCAVERELGESKGLAKCARRMRKGTRRKAQGPGRPALTEDDDDDDENELEAQSDKIRFTKADLLPHLGRTSLDLDLLAVDEPEEIPSVRIQWRIEFDWTGEAQSKMGLLFGAPAKWHGHDTRGSLSSVPDMFNKLIQENTDPMEALRTVAALLVGEG
ncbi:uncharacterized protein F4822DRAFT_301126 [Hypoxylon trugodes]|uniref:uncharacterized protein n=1 Tax=Hypoxylon trugodes TaxID=326681 RepID=UPI002195A21B|nr:uncharacterized protein F4822DRAFT_301126 [Hypoxylon trugodes]KAI1388061.1 hypothetical protein F4822DRAFT_301126 [Hypoxylon trugodes]